MTWRELFNLINTEIEDEHIDDYVIVCLKNDKNLCFAVKLKWDGRWILESV